MDHRGLLELIYRSRPSAIAELAGIAHLDETDVSESVTRLEAQGALSVHDGLILPEPFGPARR